MIFPIYFSLYTSIQSLFHVSSSGRSASRGSLPARKETANQMKVGLDALSIWKADCKSVTDVVFRQ